MDLQLCVCRFDPFEVCPDVGTVVTAVVAYGVPEWWHSFGYGVDVELCFVEVVWCDLPLNVLYLSSRLTVGSAYGDVVSDLYHQQLSRVSSVFVSLCSLGAVRPSSITVTAYDNTNIECEESLCIIDDGFGVYEIVNDNDPIEEGDEEFEDEADAFASGIRRFDEPLIPRQHSRLSWRLRVLAEGHLGVKPRPLSWCQRPDMDANTNSGVQRYGRQLLWPACAAELQASETRHGNHWGDVPKRLSVLDPPIHPRFRARVCVSAQTWLDGKVPGRPDHPWRPSTMPLTLSQRPETAVEFFWIEQ
ncbi:hypothetical protein Taro_043955 [Colocasia esculenta]|uniref:Uncharacterized protein n=1 Tax=Colocasia esculenta TaxID=4460 RepID=A0A843WTC8_COLES|nr:hypothetical protein [Colocasia esculenta]